QPAPPRRPAAASAGLARRPPRARRRLGPRLDQRRARRPAARARLLLASLPAHVRAARRDGLRAVVRGPARLAPHHGRTGPRWGRAGAAPRARGARWLGDRVRARGRGGRLARAKPPRLTVDRPERRPSRRTA